MQNKSTEEKKRINTGNIRSKKGPRQINKHRNKQMIMSMRKESGEITFDREEILKICANFCKSLYTQTVPTPESTMKSSPDRRNTRVYRRSSGKSHKKDEKTQSPRNGWIHKWYYKNGGTSHSHLPNKHLQQHTKDKADSWQLAWSKNSHSV